MGVLRPKPTPFFGAPEPTLDIRLYDALRAKYSHDDYHRWRVLQFYCLSCFYSWIATVRLVGSVAPYFAKCINCDTLKTPEAWEVEIVYDWNQAA